MRQTTDQNDPAMHNTKGLTISTIASLVMSLASCISTIIGSVALMIYAVRNLLFKSASKNRWIGKTITSITGQDISYLVLILCSGFALIIACSFAYIIWDIRQDPDGFCVVTFFWTMLPIATGSGIFAISESSSAYIVATAVCIWSVLGMVLALAGRASYSTINKGNESYE